MANWIKVTEHTFNAHLDIYREDAEVHSHHFKQDNIMVYYTGDGDMNDQQWIAKIHFAEPQTLYYIDAQ